VTRHPELWDILSARLPSEWSSYLRDVYILVERCVRLDSEDLEPQSPEYKIPKWKRSVRNVIQYQKKTGETLWHAGEAAYRLPKN